MDPFLTQCVELWQGAGSRPYEVLIEEGVYDDFLKLIEDSFYDIEQNQISHLIYRGLFVEKDRYKVGDIIEFEYPHSWTENYDMALNFTGNYESEEKGIILSLAPKHPLKGISICGFNDKFYDEEEIILCPLKVRVLKIEDDIYEVEVV